MGYTEEVFKNKGKWYGAHTGKEYQDSEVEEKGGEHWVKPCSDESEED